MTGQTLPDIIYPVRPGDENPELRYSLRSVAAHLPHDRVWIVGHQPYWVTGVEFVKGNSRRSAPANLYHNILDACRRTDMSDDIVVMNDDFFVTEPVDDIPALYRSTLLEHMHWPKMRMARGWWAESLHATLIALQVLGIDDPISYEVHTPFLARRAAMVETLEMFSHVTPHNPPQWRTLYGNLQAIGGTKFRDVKALRPGPLGAPFHSTEDTSWRYFTRQFAAMFPSPCRYEQEGAAPSPSSTRHRAVAGNR